ncbi:MAG: glycerol-3-phosphate 1-O-acyltransferase PlsY [Sphingomonadales bacterium]|nr:glycerol-3-phosphate 1-O-acyltransferase PlsY [Sphingomonadales bacterium]MDE2168009.1 glycerol-3-phosphate 1-O-acyltransferase PlsY [Sphingomonadales bacterium]
MSGAGWALWGALGLGYLLGAIPFGLILTRVMGAGDLRQIGSGNIGATNVLRTGRKGLAAATLLLDMGKGVVAVVLARALWGDNGLWSAAPLMAAAGAMVGHCFPVWLGFRGGKGVATMLGVALGLAWPVGLASALVWALAARLTKISSVGGMSAAIAAPVAALALGHGAMVPVLAALALLVVACHHQNIARLIAGTEPRVGRKAGQGEG